MPALDSPGGTPDVGHSVFVGFTFCRESMLLARGGGAEGQQQQQPNPNPQ